MEKRMKFFLLGSVLMLGLMFDARASFGQHLSASGCSISNLGYLADMAKQFETETGIKMFVRGGGSIVGLLDVRSGKVDFAASCKGKEAGDPDDIDLIQVAWDALVFIVHKTNPLETITAAEVRDIYAGKLTHWNQLKGNNEPIIKFHNKPGKTFSGIEQSLRSMILEGKEIVKTPNTIFYTSVAIVEQAIEGNPNGFGASGFSSARKRDVKMLKFNGVMPTKKNIASKAYPLRRPLYLAVPKNPRPEARKFVEYVLSRKGQALISSYGMVSLKDMK